ncbi:MAG: hypothetical protein KatS3mg129_0752 [Leptospiraceae bacterium]|nr:MAG: hypothetical protein KatS3mg129_0752 [Leptospiraceae bacterium]
MKKLNQIKIAYIPLFLFFIVFILDKIFLIKKIQLLTQKDATFLYYQYKETLLNQLEKFYQNNKENKKILIIIGSSRLMFVDYKEFKKIYPEWEMYNFSVPVNSPAYYLYIIEKIIQRNIKPDLVLLESDLFQFNEYSPGFKKSNLPYTFDLSFVLRNFNLFERDEVSEFLGYYLFAGKKYPPDLYVLWKRITNPDDKILYIYIKTEEYQKENNGCGLAAVPFREWYIRDLSEIEISSMGTKSWLYKNYKESERQWTFFRKTIHLLNEFQILYIIIKPQVSPIMEEILQNDPIIQNAYKNWQLKINKIIPHKQWIDFTKSETFYCNTFVDGTHMSKECYDPMLYEVMNLYNNLINQKK